MEGFNWALTDFDDVVEYVGSMIGDEFQKLINTANDIIEHPTDYTGPKALMTAILISAYRAKITVAAQYFKRKTSETKKPQDRLTLDALMSIYDASSEMINTLKLQTRYEKDVIHNG